MLALGMLFETAKSNEERSVCVCLQLIFARESDYPRGPDGGGLHLYIKIGANDIVGFFSGTFPARSESGLLQFAQYKELGDYFARIPLPKRVAEGDTPRFAPSARIRCDKSTILRAHKVLAQRRKNAPRAEAVLALDDNSVLPPSGKILLSRPNSDRTEFLLECNLPMLCGHEREYLAPLFPADPRLVGTF
jgi:hypothetical protein